MAENTQDLRSPVSTSVVDAEPESTSESGCSRRTSEVEAGLRKSGQPTLAELLKGVTDDNRPKEWDSGPAVGKEVW